MSILDTKTIQTTPDTLSWIAIIVFNHIFITVLEHVSNSKTSGTHLHNSTILSTSHKICVHLRRFINWICNWPEKIENVWAYIKQGRKQPYLASLFLELPRAFLYLGFVLRASPTHTPTQQAQIVLIQGYLASFGSFHILYISIC